MALEHKRIGIIAILAGFIVTPGPLSAQPTLLFGQQAGSPSTTPLYETRAAHDPNGTGKFYMGREIAQVMGPGGIP